eukprot:6447153-Prymnesium_polylepis.1
MGGDQRTPIPANDKGMASEGLRGTTLDKGRSTRMETARLHAYHRGLRSPGLLAQCVIQRQHCRAGGQRQAGEHRAEVSGDLLDGAAELHHVTDDAGDASAPGSLDDDEQCAAAAARSALALLAPPCGVRGPSQVSSGYFAHLRSLPGVKRLLRSPSLSPVSAPARPPSAVRRVLGSSLQCPVLRKSRSTTRARFALLHGRRGRVLRVLGSCASGRPSLDPDPLVSRAVRPFRPTVEKSSCEEVTPDRLTLRALRELRSDPPIGDRLRKWTAPKIPDFLIVSRYCMIYRCALWTGVYVQCGLWRLEAGPWREDIPNQQLA